MRMGVGLRECRAFLLPLSFSLLLLLLLLFCNCRPCVALFASGMQCDTRARFLRTGTQTRRQTTVIIGGTRGDSSKKWRQWLLSLKIDKPWRFVINEIISAPWEKRHHINLTNLSKPLAWTDSKNFESLGQSHEKRQYVLSRDGKKVRSFLSIRHAILFRAVNRGSKFPKPWTRSLS